MFLKISSIRCLDIKIVKDGETLYEGNVDDAPQELKDLEIELNRADVKLDHLLNTLSEREQLKSFKLDLEHKTFALNS